MDAELYLTTFQQDVARLDRELELRRAIDERLGTAAHRGGRALPRALARLSGWAGRRHAAVREAAPSAGCCAPA